ncbi:MAG: 30S ribosome-binding factor RbfA [Deltaproteobacteria bacterium]|nr:30S ribosome-binding factor RbfA [Deltaproteobacteria bacterium]
MLAGNRSHRVGDQILREISNLLLRKVKDPRLRGVTLTDVRMTKDLKRAFVYYSLFGRDEQKEQAQAGFESAKGFIRKEIGERLHLRYVPDIQFRYDISLECGQKMERLLEKLETGNLKIENGNQ